MLELVVLVQRDLDNEEAQLRPWVAQVSRGDSFGHEKVNELSVDRYYNHSG